MLDVERFRGGMRMFYDFGNFETESQWPVCFGNGAIGLESFCFSSEFCGSRRIRASMGKVGRILADSRLFRRAVRNRWEKLRASSRPYLERMNGDTILRVFVDLEQNGAL